MVDEHGAEMSTRDQKDARRVNVNFEFQPGNGGGGRRRGGQGGGGGQEREPPPHMSNSNGPGPSTGGGGRSRRERFGGHLTTEGASTPNSAGPSRRQTPSPPPPDMDPVTAQYVFSILESYSRVYLSMRRRHADLFARLRAVAPNPTNAVAALKLSLRSYNASEMGPRDLISNIWNILDRDLDNTASVVNLVIDLLEGEDKKSTLLGAWNGFKLEVSVQYRRIQASRLTRVPATPPVPRPCADVYWRGMGRNRRWTHACSADSQCTIAISNDGRIEPRSASSTLR